MLFAAGWHSLTLASYPVRSRGDEQVQLDGDSADGQIGGMDFWDLSDDLRVSPQLVAVNVHGLD